MLVVACLLYWAATRIDVDTGGRIGPAVWPKAIIVFMGLLCVYEIAKRLVMRTEFTATGLVSGAELPPAQEAATRVGEHRDDPAPDNYRMLFGGIAVVALYLFAVPWLGFFLATAVFLAVFPWVGGLRKPVVSIAVSVVGTVTLALVFLKLAYISLPLGEGPFRALSVGLMRLLGVT
jgi:hypothetical protein